MHLLVSLYIGNALLVRNCILGSGENYSTLTNLDLVNKVCSSVHCKNGKDKSTKKFTNYVEHGLAKLWVPADLLPPPFFGPRALLPKFLLQHIWSFVSPNRTHTQHAECDFSFHQACSLQAYLEFRSYWV